MNTYFPLFCIVSMTLKVSMKLKVFTYFIRGMLDIYAGISAAIMVSDSSEQVCHSSKKKLKI